MKSFVARVVLGLLLVLLVSACSGGDVYDLEGKWVEVDTSSDPYKPNLANSLLISASNGKLLFKLALNKRLISGQFERPTTMPFYFDSESSGKLKINILKSENVLLKNALSIDLVNEIEDINLGWFQRESVAVENP